MGEGKTRKEDVNMAREETYSLRWFEETMWERFLPESVLFLLKERLMSGAGVGLEAAWLRGLDLARDSSVE